ncbi:transporter [Chryseobacterium lathyri]|uniref:Transporter n=1 Tax=Chryseobacterium lathyri TaxID=395933 RepID=A0A511YER5_9FLAO|nr:transporter [Chryseobacterium lathyri]
MSLLQCIDTALAKNPQIEKYIQYNKIQKFNKIISHREYLPEVSVLMNNNLGLGTDQDVFGNTRRNDNFNNSILLNTQWFLYNGSKNKFNSLKNDFDYQSGLSDIETIKRDISINVVNQYLKTLLSKEIHEISTNSVQDALKIFNKVEKSFELGYSTKTEVLEAKSNLSKERQREQIALLDVKKNLLDLALLLQINDEESFEIENEFIPDDIEDNFPVINDLLDEIINNDPKIKSLELKLNSAKNQTEIIKTSMKPTASLISNIGSFYFNSLVADNEYQFFKQIQLNFYQQFRLNVSIPIFNKGISKLQVEKSKINEDIIINDILIEKKDLSNTIKKIFFDKNQNFKNYILSKEVEDDMKKTKELTGKSYTEGYSTIYELNNSTKNWVEAISILKQFKYKYYFDLLLLDIYTKGYSNIKYLF